MRQSNQTERTVKVDCDYVHETEKAYLVAVEKAGFKKAVKEWFPKSVVVFHEEGLNQYLEMPEGYAIDRGLV